MFENGTLYENAADTGMGVGVQKRGRVESGE